MRWNKYTITTTTQAEELVSSVLSDFGVEGVQIEDNMPLSVEDEKAMYIDIIPKLPPDEGVAFLSFFLDTEEDHSQLLENIKAELTNLRQFTEIGEGSIAVGETEDQDWINNWKQYFTSFMVEDILIKPTWEELPKFSDCRCVIEIDPGTSFGTGKHETTQLCIRQLCKYMKAEDTVLDVGCGSGILSIICLKLGASQVTGTDVDPICMETVQTNMEVNGLTGNQGSFYHGNLIDDKSLQQKVGTGCYDLVMANILADILIPLTPVIPDRLKKGGIYITSGIIDFKEEAVTAVIKESGFEILEVSHQGEWVSITARKK